MLNISAIHIYTKNYFVIKDFYADTLKLLSTYESPENDYIEYDTGAAKLVIQKSNQDVKNKITLCFKTEDVKSFRKKLQENNVQLSPLKMVLGKLSFNIKDPDGNEIQII